MLENPRVIFIIACLVGLTLYVWKDKKLERHSILFIRETERGIKTIDKIAKKFPRFWKFYGSAGVLTGILSVVSATALIGYTFINMFMTGSTEEGPALILPGTGSEAQLQAGVTFIPAEYWVISIIVLMTVHELSHGIVARAENIEIESVGWILLGLLPLGAFVKPEGEKMLPEDKKTEEEATATWNIGNWKSQIKVLCAGSFANYITAGIFLLASIGLASAVAHPGDIVYEAEEDYPAYEAGMNNGTILEINGNVIETVSDVETSLEGLEPGEQVNISSSEGNFTLTAVEREGFDGGYLGIRFGQEQEIKSQYQSYESGLTWFLSLLSMVAMLNLLIGLFNMLPIKPLDGGLTVETLITEIWGEEKLVYLNKISLIVWALLLGSILVILLGF